MALDQNSSITANPVGSNQTVLMNNSASVVRATVTEPGAAVVTSNFTFTNQDWALILQSL